jgi:hypothetical protein
MAVILCANEDAPRVSARQYVIGCLATALTEPATHFGPTNIHKIGWSFMRQCG